MVIWWWIKWLEFEGIFVGCMFDLDCEKLGFGVIVFLGVKFVIKGCVSFDDFECVVIVIFEV